MRGWGGGMLLETAPCTTILLVFADGSLWKCVFFPLWDGTGTHTHTHARGAGLLLLFFYAGVQTQIGAERLYNGVRSLVCIRFWAGSWGRGGRRCMGAFVDSFEGLVVVGYIPYPAFCMR